MKKRYHTMLPYCDILFGSVRDLTELVQWEETADVENEHDPISYIQSFMNHYDIQWFAGTRRESVDGRKQLSGYLITQQEAEKTTVYPLMYSIESGQGMHLLQGSYSVSLKSGPYRRPFILP